MWDINIFNKNRIIGQKYYSDDELDNEINNESNNKLNNELFEAMSIIEPYKLTHNISFNIRQHTLKSTICTNRYYLLVKIN